MTQRFTIQLTKTITVNIDADFEQEAVDEAVNNDDINNGDWERAEHKTKVVSVSYRKDWEFDPQVQRFAEDARLIEMAELYDQY